MAGDMVVLEEQARFLVAKYGTAAGPTGAVPHGFAYEPLGGIATAMVVLGFLILVAILAVMVRDARSMRESGRTSTGRLTTADRERPSV